ncbi:hypothetical protein N7539_004668 [Penicillium diatomitis]|uniref:Uncharacterized protein n=1 Tax=Penicillium diatomitis TaxID=2819901 RepID=A0A9X0BYW4_9EURO|nr:uncharacterized protein N7539_004668 [Penicillium diatomitis]KAJ5489778.1 hypothetical protein N7539_004668 [Penicillium diatomitis]
MYDRTIEDLARLQGKTIDTKKCRDLWDNLVLVIAITRWRETEELLAAVRSTLETIRAQKAAIGKINDRYLSPMTTTANSYLIHDISRRKIVEGILRITCLTPGRRQSWTEAKENHHQCAADVTEYFG